MCGVVMLNKRKKIYLEEYAFLKSHLSFSKIIKAKRKKRKSLVYNEILKKKYNKNAKRTNLWEELNHIITQFHSNKILSLGSLPKEIKTQDKNMVIIEDDEITKSKTLLEKLKNIPSQSIELIFALEKFHEIDEKEQVMKEISRILKKRGILILSDFYLRKKDLSEIEEIGMEIIDTFYNENLGFFEEMKEYAERVHLKIIKVEDKRKKLHEPLLSYQKYWRRKLKHPIFCFFIQKSLRDVIHQYLLLNAMEINIETYLFAIFQK